MNIYSIYKATNKITGKIYIGFDSKWPRRIVGHKYQHKKDNNTKFYNAIRKYGWDNFEWEVIYNSKDGEHCLNVMESYFIKEYDTINNGYNTSFGGNRGPVLVGSSNGMFGKTHTDKVKNDLAERSKKRFTGKTYEELYGVDKANRLKEMRSQSTRGKDNSGKNNPRFDNKEYLFFNIKSGVCVKSTRYDFYNTHKINRGGVSEMINHGITYKDWKIL